MDGWMDTYIMNKTFGCGPLLTPITSKRCTLSTYTDVETSAWALTETHHTGIFEIRTFCNKPVLKSYNSQSACIFNIRRYNGIQYRDLLSKPRELNRDLQNSEWIKTTPIQIAPINTVDKTRHSKPRMALNCADHNCVDHQSSFQLISILFINPAHPWP